MNSRMTRAPAIDIGLSGGERTKIVKGLSSVLADSYTLYLMTHNAHWTVTGLRFKSLHQMCSGPFAEQWNARDVIVERIPALGRPEPGTKEFVRLGSIMRLASIKEVEGVPKATVMIRHLVAAQAATARTAREVLPVVDGANDQPTAGLPTQRLRVHEKAARMLKQIAPERTILMRHAKSSGTGDAASYSRDDSSIQRRLGEGARRQAISTGEWLRRQGINRTMLYSSPWCRCKDTAQRLNLGGDVLEPVRESFFHSPRRAELQTPALSAFVARAVAGKGPHTVILGTPRVSITEFVGENIGSGDLVLVRADQDGRYINRRLISSPGGHQPVSP